MSLFKPGFNAEPFVRSGENLTEIAFPLGGISTGCVSLDGRGVLRDWEIFGQPNKGSWLDYTFPCLWVEDAEGASQAVTVMGPRLRDWVGDGREFWAYGHGQFFRLMDGLPKFDSLTFTGTFPVARIRFEREKFPLLVELVGLNPFIPHDVRSSSFPAAMLTYRLTNRSALPVKYCLAWNMQNPVGLEANDPETHQAQNKAFREGELTGILFTNERFDANDPRSGEVALSTSHPNVIYQERWSDEGWWDTVRAFWNRFRRDGTFADSTELGADEPEGKLPAARLRVPASLGCRGELAPGESVEIPFNLTWRFPTAKKTVKAEEPLWRSHYGTVWPSAWSVAKELNDRREELISRTLGFETALYDSSLGPEVLESVGATLSTLHTPTIVRLEDGAFWAWEGCSPKEGCCEGTCSHVWNYAVAHAFLFPEIQASFLDSALQHGFNCGPKGADGAMRFRIPIPMAVETELWHAASDGQLGQIVQAYRDWRLTADESTLRRRWAALKRAMAFAWLQWDRDRDGLVDGDMHNTYDINFVGPNPLTQFFYLAALRAMARMAEHLGDAEAETYTTLEVAGSKLTEAQLWNGSFFQQSGDFTSADSARYQHGPGCLSDQLFGQLCASLAGLGHLVNPDLVRGALRSIYENNFRAPLGEHENLQRVYAFSDESGLLLCTWPEGGMPFYPFVYSDEVWSGIEYQVASHLAFEGFDAEACSILRAIRARHDGVRRNPWNEYECGSHYARALASYGVLNAMTGFEYDAVAGTLSFGRRPFRAFWSVPGNGEQPGAFGVAEREESGTLDLTVIEGKLAPNVKILS